jgi:hypothetical protein
MPHITRKASHHFKKGLTFSENVFKENRNLYNSLNFSGNIFQMRRIKKKKPCTLKKKKASRQLSHCAKRHLARPPLLVDNTILRKTQFLGFLGIFIEKKPILSKKSNQSLSLGL